MVKLKKPIEDVALGLLARREHSVAELRRKLMQREYGRGEVEDLLGRLVASNAVNDDRYAEVRARSRAQDSKWGAGRIVQELAQNGVAKDTARGAMEALGDIHDWFEAARTLAGRRFATPLVVPDGEGREALEAYQKEKAKRIGFLVRRGFTLAQALAALEIRDEIEE